MVLEVQDVVTLVERQSTQRTREAALPVAM